MRPLLICSGDARQTQALAHVMGLAPMEFRHVFDVDDLYGHRDLMMMWGTWRERKDAGIIMDVARKRCITMLYVGDDHGPRL